MIFNLGSINADYFYDLPHLPGPGETLAASGMASGLGGKGANQSVAAALAGADTCHIGAVGPDGQWAIDRLAGFGVGTDHIAQVDTPTAHAIVMVDQVGENQIVIFPGANQQIALSQIETALNDAKPGDILLLQNETNLQVDAARIARDKGVKVIYSAAPFSKGAVHDVLPYVDILVMNAVEAAQLGDLPDAPTKIITHGADGAEWFDRNSTFKTPAFPVTPVDTTGAGDCFIGYVAAGLHLGMDAQKAMQYGAAASALQVQRPGTADAIPTAAEVRAFLSQT